MSDLILWREDAGKGREPARNDKKMWLLMLSSQPRASSSLLGGSTHKIRGQSGSPRGCVPPQSSDATRIQRLSVGDTQFRVRSAQHRASVMAQTIKHLPAMWETRVRSLDQEFPWRRQWQPTPVLLLGKSHAWRRLVGYSPRGRKKSDTTERLHHPTLHIRSP